VGTALGFRSGPLSGTTGQSFPQGVTDRLIFPQVSGKVIGRTPAPSSQIPAEPPRADRRSPQMWKVLWTTTKSARWDGGRFLRSWKGRR